MTHVSLNDHLGVYRNSASFTEEEINSIAEDKLERFFRAFETLKEAEQADAELKAATTHAKACATASDKAKLARTGGKPDRRSQSDKFHELCYKPHIYGAEAPSEEEVAAEEKFRADEQAAEDALNLAQGRLHAARSAQRIAAAKRERTVQDYNAQFKILTDMENRKLELRRSQEQRAERKAQGLPLDGPLNHGRVGPSMIDRIADAQRGNRRGPPGSDGFRRGSAPSSMQNRVIPKVPSER